MADRITASQKSSVLTPGTYEDVTFWQNELCRFDYLKDLEVGNDPGLFGWAQCTQGASQVTQWVKNLPAVKEMQETWVRSLAQEDPLLKEMATHSSTLVWRIPQTEDPRGPKESEATE